MLISYNFYNSFLLQKLINQFVRRGQKEKIELVIYKFLTNFNRTSTFSAIWLLLTSIELHKPVIAFQILKHKNKTVHKPKYKVHQLTLLGIGLHWFKEGVLGGTSRIKKKRQYKVLRKQAKEYQNKVKTRGFVLTTAEQLVIQNAKTLAFHRRQSIVFKEVFVQYLLKSTKDFSNSFGFNQQQLHNKLATESYLHHSYRWN